MLKLTDDGATITLVGSGARSGFGLSGGLFWFASALMIGSVAVLMAMSVLPERLSIGLLGLLVVGTFLFNWSRQQGAGESVLIDHGTLYVSAGEFIWKTAGKQKTFQLAHTSKAMAQHDRLLIGTADNITHQIVGFESQKEAQVMTAILNGQQLNKKLANIKMSSG